MGTIGTSKDLDLLKKIIWYLVHLILKEVVLFKDLNHGLQSFIFKGNIKGSKMEMLLESIELYSKIY